MALDFRNCFSATRSPDTTQRSRWAPPSHRFTFLQPCSTIENADSIGRVSQNFFRLESPRGPPNFQGNSLFARLRLVFARRGGYKPFGC